MSKFKVGDKVRLVDGVIDYVGLSVGDVGIVKDGHSADGWFRVVGKDKEGRDFEKGMLVNDERWELFEEPKMFIFRK